MSTVKCHNCRKEVPLEDARARRGLGAGFICSNCFWRQFITALLVIVPLAAVLIFSTANCLGRPGQTPQQKQAEKQFLLKEDREDKIRELEWRKNWPTNTAQDRQRIQQEIQKLKEQDKPSQP